jgi:hypothetical protein
MKRYTVHGTTVTDNHCEYVYTCSTEKQAEDLCRKLNCLESMNEH